MGLEWHQSCANFVKNIDGWKLCCCPLLGVCIFGVAQPLIFVLGLENVGLLTFKWN